MELDDNHSDLSVSETMTKQRMSSDIEMNTEGHTPEDILFDGKEIDEVDSEDNFLDGLKRIYEESKETGPNIDSEIAKIVNKGLRSMGQAEAMKKLKDKNIRGLTISLTSLSLE